LICLKGSAVNACTSFLMDTPDGPVYGTNLDLLTVPGDGLVLVNRRGIAKESWRTGTTGEKAKWTSEYGSVAFSLVGREYAWGGMNEAGLVTSSMELRAGEYPEPDERPPLYDGQWCQYMLDTCSSVDEVVESSSAIRVQDQSYTSHYLVADKDGNCAVFEYIDGELVCHAGEAVPVKALSNMRYSRALEAYERGGPRWWWSNPGRSAERVAACHRRSESFDARGDTPAVNYAFGTLVYHVAAPHTRWNIVFDIANRELWFRSVQSPTYKHISLNAFDFSCDAQKLMLDVNAPLEGDVEEAFVPYDHDVNVDVFHTFCDRYGIEVTREGVTLMTEFFESFECAR
jgi:choloylglycine hydrolase